MEQNNTGLPEFKIANLFEDMPILKLVQSVALRIEEEDPKLELEKLDNMHKMEMKKFPEFGYGHEHKEGQER